MALRIDTRRTRSHVAGGKYLIDGLWVYLYGDLVEDLIGNRQGHTLRRADMHGEVRLTFAAEQPPSAQFSELLTYAHSEAFGGRFGWATSHRGRYEEVVPTWRERGQPTRSYMVVTKYHGGGETSESRIEVPRDVYAARVTWNKPGANLNYPEIRAALQWLRDCTQPTGMPHNIELSRAATDAMFDAAKLGSAIAERDFSGRTRASDPEDAIHSLAEKMLARVRRRRLPKDHMAVVLTGVESSYQGYRVVGGSTVAIVHPETPHFPSAMVSVSRQRYFGGPVATCGYLPDGSAFCEHGEAPQSDFWSSMLRPHRYDNNDISAAVARSIQDMLAPGDEDGVVSTTA